MSVPNNPVVDALLAAGRRELAAHRVTNLRKPAPTPTEDTAVTDADAPADPLPAEGAPHAYVAVMRTHSPHADRPEWDQRKCLVVPEWDREHLDHLRGLGYALLPIGPDGDTGTRAITERGPMFVRYTEHNDHEGETWTFWLQRDGNEKPLRWLADFLADVNAEELDPEHELFLDDVLPEDHVDVLARWGGEAYMPLHNKVIGTMSIPEKFSPGDLYKGDVAELFAVVSDGE